MWASPLSSVDTSWPRISLSTSFAAIAIPSPDHTRPAGFNRSARCPYSRIDDHVFLRLRTADKSRFSARGKQSCHLRFVHPDTHAVARDPRLRHLEQGLSDAVSIADAHLVVRHTFNREVLAKLSVCEIASAQS